MQSQDIKPVIQRAADGFNNPQDKSAYLQLYDQNNLLLHGFPPNIPPNFQGMKAFYEALWRAFPDSHLVIDDVIAEGDKAAIRYTYSGTHKGDFMGIPPTSKRVNIGGITVLRFDSSKCVERWNVTDMMSMMQQLGAVAAPASR